ncbi:MULTISPECIES: HlyD family secretion protein [unclassified Ruegeria]|uniref:HlyD family secretion protein n=1 Tax=unclassified Ruegeria TaxID=2625375 RepID=UPI001492B24D|nr:MULTISPECIES: biotin/lipoyl-binding protein [unclassified Ruegeria]NOD47229.1 biotin/lipoyl-binding protein [Ruegeria sp. HKCCD5849]NOD51552.1 biotin/lipoyl-binding protein [Ruegeria sp. HKCCD5851]NOD69303.1 biotin/lipoyl-binding protein [Ruegeria sp. HKCCD7303]
MLIVLSLYFGLIWLVFSKLKWLPWNAFWKTVIYGGAAVIALVVLGALNHTTPTGPVSVQGIETNIAPNVSGTVVVVAVEANQSVNEGDLLFKIDPEVFAAEVSRLEASLETAKSSADQLLTDLAAAEAEIESLNAQLLFGQQRRDDIVQLEERGASTTFQLQEAVATIDQLTANIRAAEARKKGIERRISATIDGRDAAVVEAEMALEQARWSLEETEVHSPGNGVVSAVTLRPGNRATTLQGAITFIDPSDFAIVASLPQSSRQNVNIGDEIRLALRTQPGTELSGIIVALPVGSAEGTLDLRAGLPSIRELAGISSYPVLIELSDVSDLEVLPFGTSGTALVMTEKAGAIGVLAEVLFWVTKQLNYL